MQNYATPSWICKEAKPVKQSVQTQQTNLLNEEKYHAGLNPRQLTF